MRRINYDIYLYGLIWVKRIIAKKKADFTYCLKIFKEYKTIFYVSHNKVVAINSIFLIFIQSSCFNFLVKNILTWMFLHQI